MDDLIRTYLQEQIPARHPFFQEMEKQAKEDGVPIMEPDSLETMLMIMEIQQPKRILELGTAIGYSALRMAERLPHTEIITVERDQERYDQAIKNINAYGAEDQIRVIFADALEQTEGILAHGPFDAIFIDAAKAQYEKFFTLFTAQLIDEGVIYTDNVLFKGLALELEPDLQKKRRVARKMREFNQFLTAHPDFRTSFIPLGDGLAITKRKQKGSHDNE